MNRFAFAGRSDEAAVRAANGRIHLELRSPLHDEFRGRGRQREAGQTERPDSGCPQNYSPLRHCTRDYDYKRIAVLASRQFGKTPFLQRVFIRARQSPFAFHPEACRGGDTSLRRSNGRRAPGVVQATHLSVSSSSSGLRVMRPVRPAYANMVPARPLPPISLSRLTSAVTLNPLFQHAASR